MPRGHERPQFWAGSAEHWIRETVPVFYGKFTADCLTVVTIVIFNSGTVPTDRRARPVLFFLPCDRAFPCQVYNRTMGDRDACCVFRTRHNGTSDGGEPGESRERG